MWMLPLYLHVNQKSNVDDDEQTETIFGTYRQDIRTGHTQDVHTDSGDTICPPPPIENGSDIIKKFRILSATILLSTIRIKQKNCIYTKYWDNKLILHLKLERPFH